MLNLKNLHKISHLIRLCTLLGTLVGWSAHAFAQQAPTLPFYDFRDGTNYVGRFKDIPATGYFSLMIRAIHPPHVEWQTVEGVQRYKLILTQDSKILGAGEADASPHFMREGWEKVEPGRIANITIQGLDSSGKVIALSRMYRVYVAPPYDPAKVAKQRRPYREAALMAFDALEKYRPADWNKEKALIQHPILQTAVFVAGEPLPFFYPSIHLIDFANMAENLNRIADDVLRPRVVAFARSIGDLMLLARFTDKDWVYRGLVHGCSNPDGSSHSAIGSGNPKTREKLTRLVEVAKCGYAGQALLKVYDLTKDRKYLAAARDMAETFVRTQASDGYWPARADAKTGEAIAEYSSCIGSVATFMDCLNKIDPAPRWITARDKAQAWMLENPMKTYAWVVNYDDTPVATNRDNPLGGLLSNFDLFHYMNYLASHPGTIPPAELPARIREQFDWADNQFVFYGRDPLLPYEPFYPCCAEQGNPDIYVPANGCWVPMDGHTANMGSALLAYYRLTGDKRSLEIARAAGNAITQYQLNDGRTITWMGDQTFGMGAYYGTPWQNYSFWPVMWAASASFWAELAALEKQ